MTGQRVFQARHTVMFEGIGRAMIRSTERKETLAYEHPTAYSDDVADNDRVVHRAMRRETAINLPSLAA